MDALCLPAPAVPAAPHTCQPWASGAAALPHVSLTPPLPAPAPPCSGRRSDEKVPRPGGQDGASTEPTTKLWMGGIDGSASAETVRSVFGRCACCWGLPRTCTAWCLGLGCCSLLGAGVCPDLHCLVLGLGRACTAWAVGCGPRVRAVCTWRGCTRDLFQQGAQPGGTSRTPCAQRLSWSAHHSVLAAGLAPSTTTSCSRRPTRRGAPTSGGACAWGLVVCLGWMHRGCPPWAVQHCPAVGLHVMRQLLLATPLVVLPLLLPACGCC